MGHGVKSLEQFYSFLSSHPLHSLNKGEVILHQNEQPNYAYVVRSGVIKTYNLTVAGEEKTIDLVLKDEIFPLGWVFSGLKQTEYFYEALTACQIYVIPPHEFVLFLNNTNSALFNIFRQLVKHSNDYQMHINALEQSKASQKVLFTLYFLAHRFGKGIGLDTVEIQIPFTQQDMANFMGLARETTAIELKKLERRGVIAYRHRCYVVKVEKLHLLLGEDYQKVSSIFQNNMRFSTISNF